MAEEIDLSPAEEAALDRAWARVGPLLARPRGAGGLRPPNAQESDAPFTLDGPDLSGLGDLLSLTRQEVLDALFDAALDSFDLALPDAGFGAPDQPRVPSGSPEGGEWVSGGGASAGGDRAARRERVKAREEAAEARYREKAAEVRAKVNPAHAAVVRDAVAELLPKYFRRGRFGGADENSVPEGALLDELDRRGLLDAKRVYPAKVHQLLARMVFIGDLVRVEEGTGDILTTRKRVSYGLPRAADAPFYSPDQPRDERGRWTEGGGTAERPGFTPAQHRERRQAASDAVRDFARGQGPPTEAEATLLAGHLARLTVAQIHALKAEHGLKGSAPNKAALVARLAGRFAAWRAGRAPKEAVPDWPADYDVFGKRDVFADEPTDAGTLAPAAEPPALAERVKQADEYEQARQRDEQVRQATIRPGEVIEVRHGRILVGGRRGPVVRRSVRVEAVEDAEGGGQLGRFTYDDNGRLRAGYFNTKEDRWKHPSGPGWVTPEQVDAARALAQPPPPAPPPAPAAPVPERVKPSAVDTPAQGVLNDARARKAAAWNLVKDLREEIRNEPLGGDRARLRLKLMKAESAHHEAKMLEQKALAAIEARAREMGQTTKAAPPPPAPPPAAATPDGLEGGAVRALAQGILDDPDVRAGGTALVRDLRRSAGLPRADFDRALVGLIRDGAVTPHLVDSPGQWTDAERAQFLAIPVAEAHAMGLHALEGAAYQGKTYYFQSVAVPDPDRLRRLAR